MAKRESELSTRRSERRINHVKELMVQRASKMYHEATGSRVNSTKLAFVNEQLDAIISKRNPTDQDMNRVVAEMKVRFPRTSRTSGSERTASTLQPLDPKGSANVSVAPQEDRRTPQSDVLEMTPHQPTHPNIQQRNRMLQNDMWAKLSKKDLSDYEEEERKRKQLARDRMIAQKKALDEQVLQQRLKKAQLKEEEDRAHAEEAVKVVEWQAELEKEGKKRRAASELEKRDRDAQLRDMDRRKRVEEAMRKKEESAIAEKIKLELEAEQQAVIRKKQKAKDNIAKFMEYNTEQRRLKDGLRDKEHELDKQLHKMYIEKLEKQENEREQSLKKLYDRQRKQVALGSKIAAGLAERALEDERRAKDEQEKMLEKIQREERAKHAALSNEKEKIKSYLAQQISEKERKRQEEKKELVELRETMMADVRAAERQEKERVKQKREREVQNKLAIEAQIRSKTSCATDVAMSPQEIKINRQLLRRLSDTSVA